MSCDNWERGTIILPKAAWAGFRKSMIEAWNAEQERIFSLAQKAHESIEAAAKGKRNFDRSQALSDFMRRGSRNYGTYSMYAAESSGEYGGDSEQDEDTVRKLIGLNVEHVRNAAGQLEIKTPKKSKAPKRKDLRILPVSRGTGMVIGEASIVLDDATHSVTYSSGHNNRAVERANEMKLVGVLFSKLNAIEWTRGSGGKTVGNDEYNQDGDEEGRGANYAIRCFGPLGKERY